MKIYVLKPTPLGSDHENEEGFYEPVDMYGIVLRAENEDAARKLASKIGKHSGWNNPEFSTCLAVSSDGKEESILEAWGTG